jgi:hypothetical protein
MTADAPPRRTLTAQSTASSEAPSPTAPASAALAGAALDAKLAEMTTRMAAASGFDAKNAIFHEYFGAVPEADVATRQQFFFTFMSNIPKADQDRVMRFLEGLEAAKPAPAAPPAAPVAPVAPRASTAPPGVLVIGDSLTVGTRSHLPGQVGNDPFKVDGKSGRTLQQGMAIYDATPVKPRVVQMALFTNNAPNQIGELRAAVERTIADARERGGRVVWATIVGNPSRGSYDAVNDYLRDMARRNPDVMGLVDWAQMTRANPGYLAGDGYHGTPAGYRARGEAFAAAAAV